MNRIAGAALRGPQRESARNVNKSRFEIESNWLAGHIILLVVKIKKENIISEGMLIKMGESVRIFRRQR